MYEGTKMYHLLQTLYDSREGKLGQVYVKYVEPIDLFKYVQDFNYGSNESLGTKGFQSLAMKLT